MFQLFIEYNGRFFYKIYRMIGLKKLCFLIHMMFENTIIIYGHHNTFDASFFNQWELQINTICEILQATIKS